MAAVVPDALVAAKQTAAHINNKKKESVSFIIEIDSGYFNFSKLHSNNVMLKSHLKDSLKYFF